MLGGENMDQREHDALVHVILEVIEGTGYGPLPLNEKRPVTLDDGLRGKKNERTKTVSKVSCRTG